MFRNFKRIAGAGVAALICAASVQPAGADISTTQAHFAYMPVYGVLATFNIDVQNEQLVLQTYAEGSGVFGNAYSILRGEAKIHVSYVAQDDGTFVMDAWNIVAANF